MDTLTINLVFSTLVFGIIARIYLWPRLDDVPSRSILLPILILHSFRHLGMMFLDPGATYDGMPGQFAYPAAYGDLLAALLALACIAAIRTSLRRADLLVWTFNIIGTLDLLVAITLATLHDASAHMGAAFWIPAFWVPALLVTHYVTFVVLWRHRSTSGAVGVNGRVAAIDEAARTSSAPGKLRQHMTDRAAIGSRRAASVSNSRGS